MTRFKRRTHVLEKVSSGWVALMFLTVLSGSAEAEVGKLLTPAEMREAFAVEAQVLVLSEDGKRVVRPVQESRSWQGMSPAGEFRRDWSTSHTGFGAFQLRQAWKIDDSGNMTFTVEEFRKSVPAKDGAKGPEFTDSLGKEEHSVLALAPVTYRVKSVKNLAVRFIPSYVSHSAARELSGHPLVTREATLFDSEGDLWAYGLESDSNFVGFQTRMGTVALSFAKFAGSSPIGVAQGSKISVKGPGTPTLILQSRGPLLPEGVTATVHARILPHAKSNALNSITTFESGERSRFDEKLKKQAQR